MNNAGFSSMLPRAQGAQDKPAADSKPAANELARLVEDLGRDMKLLNSSVENMSDMYRVTYDTLISELKAQLKFDDKQYNDRLTEVLELFSIERGLLSDDQVGLVPEIEVRGERSVVGLALQVTCEGQVLISSRDVTIYIVGSGKLPPGVETALIGKKAGDEVSVDVAYEDGAIPNLRGKVVKYQLQILWVKRRS